MTRKTLLVLAVAFLAAGVLVGFAGSAGAAHAPADGGGTSSQDCQDYTQPGCIGGGGGDDGGGGGGDCGAGPEPACIE